MKNIFDQFKQPENRLTHALACCLHHDRNLLRSFLIDLLKITPPATGNLSIIEQSLPGRFADGLVKPNIDSSIGNGLPDMIIFDEEGWCVVIESKVASSICSDQIKRHFATLRRRGYLNPHGVVIAIEEPQNFIPGCSSCTWNSIYKWMSQFCNDSFWAKELRNYFEILERNMTDEGYLTTGTITDFIGIPFDDRNPFTYLEGKRILKLMVERLKLRKGFDQLLNVDYESGRGSITNHSTLWDIISLKNINSTKNFMDFPHFTFGFTENNLKIMFTLPDKTIKTKMCSLKNMQNSLANFVEKLRLFNVHSDLYAPKIKLNQRHYLHRRSEPIVDGVLEFDLRTITTSPQSENDKVKKQGGWLHSLYTLCQAKSSNMQLQIGVYWSYKYLSKLSPEDTLELVERSCNAMVDLVSLMKNDVEKFSLAAL